MSIADRRSDSVKELLSKSSPPSDEERNDLERRLVRSFPGCDRWMAREIVWLSHRNGQTLGAALESLRAQWEGLERVSNPKLWLHLWQDEGSQLTNGHLSALSLTHLEEMSGLRRTKGIPFGRPYAGPTSLKSEAPRPSCRSVVGILPDLFRDL